MKRTIDKYISRLLFEHECVVVPDFGAFLTRYHHAGINSATYMMRPPSRRVSFNKRISENDGLLAKYISREENITYSQALEAIAISVRGWKRVLRVGKKVFLPGIGRLYMDNDARIQFNPSIDVNYDKASFGLEIFRSPAIRREAEVNTIVRKAIEEEVSAAVTEKQQKQYFPAWKWAAVITPFLGLGIAAGIYFNDISSFQNFSGLPPFSSHTAAPSGNAIAGDKSAEKEVENVVDPVSASDSMSAGENSAEKIISPLSPEESVAKVAEASYHIIVGSFKTRENAESYIFDLRSKGYDAYIAAGNGDFNRVAIGKYTSHEQAGRQLLNVKREVNSGSWIYAN